MKGVAVMWLAYAIGSALFAAATTILAKVGIRKTDSTVATAIRTVVVLAMSWGMVFVAGSQDTLRGIDKTAILYLVLSGLATGASWLCYFHALKVGDVNHVVPVDKCSVILTILLAFLLLKEPFGLAQAVGMVLIGAGTLLMVEKKRGPSRREGNWLPFALGSAFFASVQAILAKIGMTGVESNLGTALRTGVVLVMAWLMVLVTGKGGQARKVGGRELLFICLSGVATGGSWLCYYRALQEGPASVVVSIDKLSILAVSLFAWLFLKERLSRRAAVGLCVLTAGTLAMVLGA